MHIVVTIPAYNEEQTLGPVLDAITHVLRQTSYSWQLLVVDDGSVDRTAAVAQAHGAHVVAHPRNLGLAAAFQTELATCLSLGADILVHTDADGQYDPAAIPLLIRAIEDGADLALGSRFLRKAPAMPVMNRLGNQAFSLVFSHLLNQKITDTTTGFRAFTATVAREVAITNSFTYTQEQLLRAAKQKFRIVEVPVRTRKTRPSRLFKNPFSYAVKAWINILRIYRDYDPLRFFGSAGLFFFGIGLLLGFVLLFLFVTEGKVGHLPSVVLTAIFLLLGIQFLFFGFLADMLRH